MENSLKEQDWRRLLRNIVRGKCILLLGPDITEDTADSAQPCFNVRLANRLADVVASKIAVCDRDDLAHVAQLYLTHRMGDRTELELEVEDFYQPQQAQRSDIHDCLAALPLSLCITTTPDKLMVNAFKQAGKTPTLAYYHFRSGGSARLGLPDAARPLVYQLYGHIGDSSSLVLTETDQLDFLVNVISNRPELPPELASQFSDPDMSFLFVGFGFQHWYLRILLHVLRKELPKNAPRSLALEGTQFFADPQGKKTALFFDQAQAIEFKQCSWGEFARELRRRCSEEKAAATMPTVQEPSSDAPTVFLCHSSQDSELVGRLGEQLRAKGLNTWRDRDNLRGGEDWDWRLMHVIEYQVDYFLVLQTPHFISKVTSYCYKEITAARERQKSTAQGFRFIIPAFLVGDGKQKLSELEDLNYLDLRQDYGLGRLVNDIWDDHRRRQERIQRFYLNK